MGTLRSRLSGPQPLRLSGRVRDPARPLVVGSVPGVGETTVGSTRQTGLDDTGPLDRPLGRPGRREPTDAVPGVVAVVGRVLRRPHDTRKLPLPLVVFFPRRRKF